MVKYDNQNIKISDCLILIGWNFYKKGDFYSAKAKYIDAIKILNQEFDRANKNEIVELTAKGLYNLGILLSNEGNYNFAIRAYNVSERIYSLTGNEKNCARSKVAKAIVYSLKNINSKALSEYFNELKIYEKLDNISVQTSILGNIGFTYYNLKEYDKALDYYHRALTLAQKQKNLIYEAQLHENIGSVYDEQLNISEAEKSYNKAMQILEKTNDLSGIWANTINRASINLKKNNYDTALYQYKAAYDYFFQSNDLRGRLVCLVELGRIYIIKNKLP